MSLATRDIFEVKYGDTWGLEFDVQDEVTGDILPLDGATVKMRVYDKDKGVNLIAEIDGTVNESTDTFSFDLNSDATFWPKFGTADKIKAADYEMRFIITQGGIVQTYPNNEGNCNGDDLAIFRLK